MVGFQKHIIKIGCSGNEWIKTEKLIKGYSNVRVSVIFLYGHSVSVWCLRHGSWTCVADMCNERMVKSNIKN